MLVAECRWAAGMVAGRCLRGLIPGRLPQPTPKGFVYLSIYLWAAGIRCRASACEWQHR